MLNQFQNIAALTFPPSSNKILDLDGVFHGPI